ncbi:hypothetical protein J416_10131 [Gracilibacillus halophilus YIM-C55.5]|uniref:Glycosyltransferase n=1 Tax=Gracilibacillus halophilus YIM-C55.5 TaxID=1308866 RepID=N4WKC0_9BACI|nr:glycosyltransferase [Gracilibacillus halophilus]ENH96582.1 hypothetical protein J416_10131 [Gracilibacillus halophilus YIM-C55.5]
MLKQKIKKILVSIIELFAYKILNSQQRRALFNRLPARIRHRFKGFVKVGKTQKKFKKVERIRYKLRNLGFEEEAIKEFEEMIREINSQLMRRVAAWELAVWFANKQTREGAQKSMEYLPIVSEEEKDTENLRKIAIIEAENLVFLDEKEKAHHLIQEQLHQEEHPDLYLATVNTENHISDRLKWINKVYDYYQLEQVQLNDINQESAYDQLTVRTNESGIPHADQAKVTVIVPVYNATDGITTALDSIRSQTWTNLEILVVDDCSQDDTQAIVKDYEHIDDRIKLLQTPENSGAYVARNIALQQASGEFVTINDADDWSHPRKIEVQANHLLTNHSIIGNTSQQARATEKLNMYRRGKPGLYLFSNMSSFMFRRETVMNEIGYWDCVRFGGDSEFIKRIKTVFGEDQVHQLETGPLSFQRQSESSLTGNSSFGFPGFFMGARKEYLEAQVYYHKTHQNLYYEFPQNKRPFAAPEPMLPGRIKNQRRHFDVILVSDFRLDGGSTLSNVEEIIAQKKYGYKTGIVQMARYDYPPKKKINPRVRELIDGEQVQMLVYGEQVSCDVLIVRYPPLLQVKQKYVPDIQAKDIRLIINQPPKSAYGLDGDIRYDLTTIDKHMKDYFGSSGTWHPIGPLIRDALQDYHAEEIRDKPLSDHNWLNIIDLQDWKKEIFEHNRNTEVIKIGRHSRDSKVKWPEDKETLLSIFPETDRYEVHVLGGAKTPKQVIGYIPDNWRVYQFGELTPQDFLKQLDVFIYFTHSDWVESFGRVIIEAMAIGVPVILPHVYEPLFEDAAFYATPATVEDTIEHIMNNQQIMKEKVEYAKKYIEANFSYRQHYHRLQTIIDQ